MTARRSALGTILILAIAAAPRLWAAIGDQGIFWPDEIFQSLEPAHQLVFGYGFTAWELQEGARSWLFPGLLAALWKLLTLLGVHDAPTLVITAKVAMAIGSVAAVYGAMRVAADRGGERAAVLCGCLAIAFPPGIVYGSRCLSETVTAPLVIFAVLLCLGERRRRARFAAGVLAGLAGVIRSQNGLIALGLALMLIAQSRRRDLEAYGSGLVLTVVAGGVLDRMTWGGFFHSFWTYWAFNLEQGGGARFGVEPAGYYAHVLATAVGWPALPLGAGLLLSLRRAPALGLIVLAFVIAHAAVPHKELRFLLPIMPLASSLSALGLSTLLDRSGSLASQLTWGGGLALAIAMASRSVNATFTDFGQNRPPLGGRISVWQQADDVNRLLWRAGERSDLCGLALIGWGPIWSGGFTYLHRDVAFLWASSPEQLAVHAVDAANYVVAQDHELLPSGYSAIVASGRAVLGRRNGPCTAPPEETRLFKR